jgi:hypothetical protein
MVFDASGAALSRAVLGDGPFTIILPLVIAGVVLTSWALRPAGRTLLAPFGSKSARREKT